MERREALTLEAAKECVNLLNGALQIAYPAYHGLPTWEPARLLLEGKETTGSPEISEVKRREGVTAIAVSAVVCSVSGPGLCRPECALGLWFCCIFLHLLSPPRASLPPSVVLLYLWLLSLLFSSSPLPLPT